MVGILLTMLAIGLFLTQKYYPSLLIFFGFVSYGYLVIPPAFLLAGSPIEKTTDLAILYVLAILLFRLSTTSLIARKEPVFRWILIFLGFALIDTFYSHEVLGYDLAGVIRVFRSNLIFLSFGVLVMVPTTELLRVWHSIAIITVLQCIIYLLQLPVGAVLLGASYNITVNNMETIGWVRYYNTPSFLIPVFFYYLFVYRNSSRMLHWGIVGLLAATVIAPMHRSYILIVVLVISVYIMSQQTFSKRLIYIGMLVVAVNGALLIAPIRARVDTGLSDLSNTFAPGRSLAAVDYNAEDTFSYRMAHLFERVNYVLKEPGRLIFGVGMLSEDTQQAAKLNFEAGLFNERLGRISQVDTGDITWSLLILYLGVAGTILFIFMLIRFIRFFYQHRSMPLSVVGLLTLSTTLFLSFTGTDLVQIHFRAILIMLLATTAKLVKMNQLASQSDTPLTDEPEAASINSADGLVPPVLVSI
ncbi:hypothetical protein [Spirosoma sp. KNUC1025]|uniref:hypothetical protein n=1 Tax=Spirosoma sp. KNUC1025 TaxID=2894082 RepID=UPI00386B3A33|nr:hypothetical protein LN737_09800 [Spirosoma sp. KNUC1025]